MIRTKATVWRVQVRDDCGRWADVHEGSRAGPAIRAYEALDTNHKRLLRNGEPLRMSAPDELNIWEAG